MAKHRCTTSGCGRQMFNPPTAGYQCPNCGAIDSYVLVQNTLDNNLKNELTSSTKKAKNKNS